MVDNGLSGRTLVVGAESRKWGHFQGNLFLGSMLLSLGIVFVVFEFMKNRNLAYPLKTELSAGENVYITAQACSTEDGNMVIIIVNQGTKAVPTTIEIPSGYKATATETLFAPDRLSRAKLGKDEIQSERQKKITEPNITLRPISITKVFLQPGS